MPEQATSSRTSSGGGTLENSEEGKRKKEMGRGQEENMQRRGAVTI